MTPEQHLAKLGVTLPAAPTPLGEYVASKQSGALLFLSGMLPIVNGRPAFIARVPQETARAAARLATLNALAVVQQRLGTLDRVHGVVRVAVYIAADPDFTEHAFIADGCSTLLNDVFPESNRHARLVFGVSSLPMGMPVELDLIFEVD